MRFVLALPFDSPEPSPAFQNQHAIRRMASTIEEAGFDACSVTDHPYPVRTFLATGGHHTLDPLVALACAGTATTTLRLLTNCFIPAYRHPAISAKGVATLDRLTDGRLILGVAAGYLEGEFDALGVPFRGRGALLDQAIAAMKEVWRGNDAAGDNVALPTPVTTPHPPIWIGGNSRTAMRRAVAAGDGWMPFPAPPKMAEAIRTQPLRDHDDLSALVEEAKALMAEAGRDDELDVCFTPLTHPHWKENCDPDALAEEATALARLGVTWLSFHLPAPSLDAFCDNIVRMGEEAIKPLKAHG